MRSRRIKYAIRPVLIPTMASVKTRCAINTPSMLAPRQPIKTTYHSPKAGVLKLNAGILTIGRGNKSGRASAMRISKAKHSLSAGIYAVDFAACPEKLPRPAVKRLGAKHTFSIGVAKISARAAATIAGHDFPAVPRLQSIGRIYIGTSTYAAGFFGPQEAGVATHSVCPANVTAEPPGLSRWASETSKKGCFSARLKKLPRRNRPS